MNKLSPPPSQRHGHWLSAPQPLSLPVSHFLYIVLYMFSDIYYYIVYIYYAIVVVVEFVIANKSLFTTKIYTLFFCE